MKYSLMPVFQAQQQDLQASAEALYKYSFVLSIRQRFM